MKYYQNEITTIETFQIAWMASLGAGDPKTTAAVIEQIGKSDRNSRPIGGDGVKGNSEVNDLLDILEKVSKLILSAAKTTKAE